MAGRIVALAVTAALCVTICEAYLDISLPGYDTFPLSREDLHNFLVRSNEETIAFVSHYNPGIWKDEKDGKSFLHVVCSRQTVESLESELNVVKLLLINGANVSAIDSKGRTPLHYVALSDFYTAVQVLRSVGADIDAQDDNGDTPLHLAARMNYAETVEKLTYFGANRFIKNHQNLTPIGIAFKETHISLIKYLSQQRINQGGANHIYSPLDLVCILNYRDFYNSEYDYTTTLHRRIYTDRHDYERYERFRVDDDDKKHIDSKDIANRTPLHWACFYGTFVAKKLIENGANVSSVDWFGHSPLHLASSYNNEDLVQLLLQKGAKSYEQDRLGHTAYDLTTSENIKSLLLYSRFPE